ncbi:LOW QUALITY PROTEIN: epidermal growth factor-like protein 6 [Colossoma macropomum]|uniref:LOW QUALITY PROTEIN: epidermal growth factor-like protein 6 n=1 Tax=Colossoma macropomum TaxID=42526 RepID=UPI0018653A7E|nr:LOW QUALITY PROTEIN: epidermal growth factor-like protein 6 [Colossoma macropomum]
MKPFTWISSLSFLLFVCPGRAEHRQIRQISAGNLAGVCRYGSRLECCYGWKKNSKGHCEAQCEFGCKHGECVGPNKCKCFPGYTGKTCSQDLNECGLKPRPCEHRCMNTFGSYMCYCLNGYTLMPDGSCANSRTCALAHCQYGCEEVEGEIRCLCPSAGLQLGPDGKTCADIDECVTGKNQCPYNRQCVNTFGSYYCKCQGGYDLKYVNGKYDCVDVNECVSNTHKCSRHAECINTQGSYKCKCKQGFRGSGFDCSVKPFYRSSWDGDKGSADEFPNAIPDTPSRPRILGKFDNTIPEPKVTQLPRLRLQPFDYDGEVYIGPSEEDAPVFPSQEKDEEEEEEEEEEEDDGENEGNQVDGEKLNPRGDVFFPDESVYSAEFKEINAAPLQERLLTDCNFDSGACEWVQDKEDDLDWTVQYHENGLQYYMALSGLVGNRRESARLRLLLTDLVQQGPFCLKFSFRIAGPQVGTLRVMLDHSDHAVWEKAHSRNEDWQTDSVTITWKDRAPEMIIFEGTRGKLVAGEIGLDNVVLISGSCQDDEAVIF